MSIYVVDRESRETAKREGEESRRREQAKREGGGSLRCAANNLSCSLAFTAVAAAAAAITPRMVAFAEGEEDGRPHTNTPHSKAHARDEAWDGSVGSGCDRQDELVEDVYIKFSTNMRARSSQIES